MPLTNSLTSRWQLSAFESSHHHKVTSGKPPVHVNIKLIIINFKMSTWLKMRCVQVRIGKLSWRILNSRLLCSRLLWNQVDPQSRTILKHPQKEVFSISKHMKSHTLNTLSCSKCDYTTNTKVKLKRHTDNVHLKLNIKCKECPFEATAAIK